MKSLFNLMLGAGLIVSMVSCSTTSTYGNNYPRNNGRHLPPGQAKKIYGGETKDYAPGQRKKHGHYGTDNGWGNDNHGNRHGKGHHNKHKKDND